MECMKCQSNKFQQWFHKLEHGNSEKHAMCNSAGQRSWTFVHDIRRHPNFGRLLKKKERKGCTRAGRVGAVPSLVRLTPAPLLHSLPTLSCNTRRRRHRRQSEAGWHQRSRNHVGNREARHWGIGLELGQSQQHHCQRLWWQASMTIVDQCNRVLRKDRGRNEYHQCTQIATLTV